MPGHARLSLPGIPCNIIQRGNNRSACFYTDEDYCRYLDTLKEQADKHGCLIHAYVLMTNLVHLLLTAEKEERASLLMKHLGQRYLQYINRTYIHEVVLYGKDGFVPFSHRMKRIYWHVTGMLNSVLWA